ncbi:MAG: transposase [Alphaproteobacteria bacterium]|nr:transposase [Alphaproteobacteria bacterium]
MAQVQVISGVERRRRWSKNQKRLLVAAAFAPGAVVSEIARQADVCPGQIYRWRQDLEGQSNGFSEVVVSPVNPAAIGLAQMIEVIVGDHAQVRIPASIPPDLAAAVIGALVRR